MSDSIVTIPLSAIESQVAFGNVGSVVYRDTVNGVRFTAHYNPTDGTAWIVRHAEHNSGSDGKAVARSPLLYGDSALNAAWHAVRNTDRP